MKLATEERTRLSKRETGASNVGMGWEAYKAGRPISSNPFPLHTDDADEWRKGWFDSRRSFEKAAANHPGWDKVQAERRYGKSQ